MTSQTYSLLQIPTQNSELYSQTTGLTYINPVPCTILSFLCTLPQSTPQLKFYTNTPSGVNINIRKLISSSQFFDFSNEDSRFSITVIDSENSTPNNYQDSIKLDNPMSSDIKFNILGTSYSINKISDQVYFTKQPFIVKNKETVHCNIPLPDLIPSVKVSNSPILNKITTSQPLTKSVTSPSSTNPFRSVIVLPIIYILGPKQLVIIEPTSLILPQKSVSSPSHNFQVSENYIPFQSYLPYLIPSDILTQDAIMSLALLPRMDSNSLEVIPKPVPGQKIEFARSYAHNTIDFHFEYNGNDDFKVKLCADVDDSETVPVGVLVSKPNSNGFTNISVFFVYDGVSRDLTNLLTNFPISSKDTYATPQAKTVRVIASINQVGLYFNVLLCVATKDSHQIVQSEFFPFSNYFSGHPTHVSQTLHDVFEFPKYVKPEYNNTSTWLFSLISYRSSRDQLPICGSVTYGCLPLPVTLLVSHHSKAEVIEAILNDMLISADNTINAAIYEISGADNSQELSKIAKASMALSTLIGYSVSASSPIVQKDTRIEEIYSSLSILNKFSDKYLNTAGSFTGFESLNSIVSTIGTQLITMNEQISDLYKRISNIHPIVPVSRGSSLTIFDYFTPKPEYYLYNGTFYLPFSNSQLSVSDVLTVPLSQGSSIAQSIFAVKSMNLLNGSTTVIIHPIQKDSSIHYDIYSNYSDTIVDVDTLFELSPQEFSVLGINLIILNTRDLDRSRFLLRGALIVCSTDNFIEFARSD